LKLVLLPGMDGTGILFEDFVKVSKQECLVIPLPVDGKQDHKSLAEHVGNELPDEGCIIRAESFSGGFVPHLLDRASNGIRGVIFVASFLSPPNRALMFLAKMLPIEMEIPFWIIKRIVKKVFLAPDTPDDIVFKCAQVIRSVPKETLRKRMICMAQMKLPDILLRVHPRPIGKKEKMARIFKGFFQYRVVSNSGAPFHFAI